MVKISINWPQPRAGAHGGRLTVEESHTDLTPPSCALLEAIWMSVVCAAGRSHLNGHSPNAVRGHIDENGLHCFGGHGDICVNAVSEGHIWVILQSGC